MRPRSYIFLIAIVLTLTQLAGAQVTDSYVTVSISKARNIVTGSVADSHAKKALVQIIGKQCGTADHNGVRIDPRVQPFEGYWQRELEDLLSDCNRMKAGFIRFQSSTVPAARYTSLSRQILNSEVLLADGSKGKFSEFTRGVVIVTFIEPWVPPARMQIPLFNGLAREYKNLNIVGLSFDTELTDNDGFWKFAKMTGIEYPVGRVDVAVFERFANISRSYHVLPQTFVIENGQIRGSFIGSSEKVDKAVRDLVGDILENRRKPK